MIETRLKYVERWVDVGVIADNEDGEEVEEEEIVDDDDEMFDEEGDNEET